MKSIKNINILILLIYIDRMKLWIIHIIIYLYIWLFDILEWTNENKKIKGMIQIFKSIIINPILLIIYKFYYLLYIWMSTPLKIILVNRIYGIIFSVLIFMPLLNILLINNWLYLYILIILISILDDSKFKYKKYINIKLIYYILYIIESLNLNKDILLILEYRSRASIFAILIKNGIKEIKDRNNKINKYAFEINIIYKNALIGSQKEMLEKLIIDYDSELKNIKIIKMRESFVLVNNYFSFFRTFCLNWVFELDLISYNLSHVIYCRLQKFYILNIEKLEILEVLLYKLIKLILFYFWNLLKVLGEDKSNILNNFIIKNQFVGYDLIYDYEKLLSNKKLIEINEIIKNKDFYLYKEYYERIFLYISISGFFYNENKRNKL